MRGHHFLDAAVSTGIDADGPEQRKAYLLRMSDGPIANQPPDSRRRAAVGIFPLTGNHSFCATWIGAYPANWIGTREMTEAHESPRKIRRCDLRLGGVKRILL